MLNKVKNYIKKHNLLDDSKLYIVALSGGGDSVALLLLLDEMGYKTHAAHCNFHLRGIESDRDELFCESLCSRKNIPFHRVYFDTLTYAETHKVSIEMAARQLRYHYFEQLRSDVGAAGICVAHHRDDSVETVLINLVRGTGLRGLTGILPRNGNVIRPLLCVSKTEIESYLAEKGQEYVTDSTNLVADVMRNKVRLQVLPLLRQLNPSVSENIQRTAENLYGAQMTLDAIFSDKKKCNELSLSSIKDSYSREYIAYEWLKIYGFNGTQVRQILDASIGSIITSSTGYDVLMDRDRLIVEPSLKPMKSLIIPEEGTYLLSDNRQIKVHKQVAFVSKEPDVATIDAQKVQFPLTVRMVQSGDWMIPFGMDGRKLLNDLMADNKMTHFEKRRQLVVVDSQGIVVWLVGLRIDARVSVNKSTQEVLVCKMSHFQS